MDLKDRVLKVFKDSEDPLRSAEIAGKLDVEKKEVDKAIKALKKEDKIFSPIRCKYTIK